MRFEFEEKHEALSVAVAASIASDNESSPGSWWVEGDRDLSLRSLAIPVEHGGQGDFAALAVVLRETGRALAPSPLLASAVLAASALQFSLPCPVASHILSDIASGQAIATVAVAETGTGWTLDPFETTAAPASSGYIVTGRKVHVVDGATADVVIVAASGPGGPSLFAVDRAATGVGLASERTLDPSRPLATITFDGAPARLVGVEGDAMRVLQNVLDRGLISVAAEQLGGAEACLAMVKQHVSTREQGGRKLGSRQTVRNACVTMLGDIESARSIVHYAVWAVQEQLTELPVLATVAGQHCSDAFINCARTTVQLHGGSGFLLANDPHRYLRRALSSSRAFLHPAQQREMLVDRLISAGDLFGTAPP